MEGLGSRDMVSYYLGGRLPSPSSRQTRDEQPVSPNPLDLLNPNPSSTGDVSSAGLGPESLVLSAEEQSLTMRSIQEVFELEEEVANGDQEMDDEDGEEVEAVVDLEDRARRAERLKGVLSTLAQLWWSDSEQLDLAAEKLADGSRDPKWRIPLGDSGVLIFFLEILSGHTLRHTLKIHILRLIGNSCADTDENRARVVASNYLPSIIDQLKDSSLLPFAIPVLYNICIDYEPAQQQASISFLGKELIELISSPRFNESRAFLGYICRILDLLIAQPSEPELAPENTPIVLLKISADRESPTDMDDYIALVNTAIAYLQHVRFQQALITQGGLDTALAVLVDSYTRFDSQPSIGSPSVGSSSPDQDEAKLLSEMRSNVNQALSDVSALPEFKEAVPVISPFSSSLRRWISSPQLQLQVCACIMLGNLARSDDACEEFVHTSQVHKPLITVLTNTNDSQLLHAALGFLKNLALPMKNKEALGEAGIFEVLPRLWLLDTLQQIQFSSISLARQLLTGTWENVRRVAKRLSDDQDSPAQMRTNLSLLIALFDRTDAEPIKMEISRLITGVCRVFNTYKDRSPEEMERIRRKFFTMHPDVGRPLGFMVSQTKWPVVRSEGWFVFALMARYPEGAQCISDLMQDITVFQPLVEVLTGKFWLGDNKSISSLPSSEISEASPASGSGGTGSMSWEGQTPDTKSPTQSQGQGQEAEMARIDRENALILISELLKNRGPAMAVMRRTLFEDLLKGGGEIHMTYQDASMGEVSNNEKRVRAGLNLAQIAEQSSSKLS